MPAISTETLEKAIADIDQYAGTAARIRGIRLRAFQTQLDQIEQLVEDLLRSTIADLTDEQCEATVKRINERRSNLALKTGATTEVVGISKQVLVFGIAGVALAIGFVDKIKSVSITFQKILAVMGIFYSELLLCSLFVLSVYTLQSRFRYPSLYFRKIGNTWPWFYYSSISDQVSRGVLQWPRTRFQACKLYAQDLLKFSSKALGEDSRERVRLELQQYFLLIAYQGYVHQFGLRLANYFLYGFSGAVLSAVVLFVLMFFGVI